MTTLKSIVLAGSLALAACGGASSPGLIGEATAQSPGIFDQLRNEAFSVSNGSPSDVDALFALLPDGVTASYGDVVFDADSGATTVSGLRFSIDDSPEIALAIETLDLWGVDAARLQSGVETGSAKIIDRVDAKGVSVTGLEEGFQTLTDAYVEGLTEGLALDEDGAAALDFTFESYDLSVEQIILSGLTIHADDVGDAEIEDDGQAAIAAFAKALRSVSFDNAAAFGQVVGFKMTQAGIEQSFDYNIDLTGYAGYDRGDLAYTATRGMTISGLTPFPDFTRIDEFSDDPDAQPPMIAIPVSGYARLQEWKNVRLSKALSYVVRAEAPPLDDTDLWSLGEMRLEEFNYALSGKDFLRMDAATIDLTGFHWLLPSDIEADLSGFAYDFTGIKELLPAIAAEDGPEAAAFAVDLFDILEANNALEFTIDANVSYEVDPETGNGVLNYQTKTRDWLSDTIAIEGQLPSFPAFSAFVDANGGLEGVDGDAFGDFFAAETSFNSASYTLNDLGGLARIFKLVVELAAVAPEDAAELKGFANYT
ncbi:MAG: hypothetical protein AAFQ67_02980, partial [Pseudomonadota bacterium]